MALYNYQCQQHGDFDLWQSMDEVGKIEVLCEKCGAVCLRVWGSRIKVFKPYWSKQLSSTPGKSVYIDSINTKRSLMKKYGLEEDGCTQKERKEFFEEQVDKYPSIRKKVFGEGGVFNPHD